MVDYRLDSAGKIQENSLKTVIPDWSEYVLPLGQTSNPADVKKAVPPSIDSPSASSPPTDPTAKEYADWYRRVSPQLDKEHKGYLTFGDIYEAGSHLRGKDEAMALVAKKHFNEFSRNTSKLNDKDIGTIDGRMSPDSLENVKKEIDVTTKAEKVADWIRDNRDKLHTDKDGLLSSSELKKAIGSSEFADPESQRMLHFLQSQYSMLATIRGQNQVMPGMGIPTRDHQLESMVESTTSKGALERLYADKFGVGGAIVGLWLGMPEGLAGMGIGLTAGAAAGEGLAAFNYYAIKQDPYKAFLKDLDAAVDHAK